MTSHFVCQVPNILHASQPNIFWHTKQLDKMENSPIGKYPKTNETSRAAGSLLQNHSYATLPPLSIEQLQLPFDGSLKFCLLHWPEAIEHNKSRPGAGDQAFKCTMQYLLD